MSQTPPITLAEAIPLLARAQMNLLPHKCHLAALGFHEERYYVIAIAYANILPPGHERHGEYEKGNNEADSTLARRASFVGPEGRIHGRIHADRIKLNAETGFWEWSYV